MNGYFPFQLGLVKQEFLDRTVPGKERPPQTEECLSFQLSPGYQDLDFSSWLAFFTRQTGLLKLLF